MLAFDDQLFERRLVGIFPPDHHEPTVIGRDGRVDEDEVAVAEPRLHALAAHAQHERLGAAAYPSPTGRVLNDSTLSKLLREIGVGAVPHGFRSRFRDWAAECCSGSRAVCELALAHVNSDRGGAAYRRSDLFEHSRQLMEDWAAYIAS